MPYDEASARAMIRENVEPTAIYNNCSGKHAGILALSTILGADAATYLELQHPAQQRILQFCARAHGDDAATWPIGVDGCGIPVYATSLRKAALAFAGLRTHRSTPSKTTRERFRSSPMRCERIPNTFREPASSIRC